MKTGDKVIIHVRSVITERETPKSGRVATVTKATKAGFVYVEGSKYKQTKADGVWLEWHPKSYGGLSLVVRKIEPV